MHNVVRRNGELHHVVIVPDGETAVNRKGNRSVRGGALGLKPYNPKRPTADRLQQPLMRVRGMLQPVAWEDATSIVAEASKHILARHGEAAWGIK
jgi:arsenite oxidase large subunit